MRIALIAPPWLTVPPAAYGGTEYVVEALALELQAAGHDVLLAAADDSTCPVPRLAGLAPSDPAALGQSLNELQHVLHAYAELGDVDIIHDHTLIGPHLTARPAVPVVTTAHGRFTPAMLEVFGSLPQDVSAVAISRHQASTASGVRIARVIHHGIDPATVPFGAGSGGYCCFLGRMSPDKGVATAIEVAHRAGVPLRIAAKVHEQSEREYFDTVVRPLLGRSDEFLGELTRPQKAQLLGGAIATLNPIAWDEPFGLVMIEALAAGTPVIATPRGSVPEIVDDGVTGFIGATVPQLADALARVGELDRSACRSSVEERFSARRMAADYADLYGELIVGHRTSRESATGRRGA